MAIDIITLTLSKKYVDESIAGTSGVLVGKSAFEVAQINGFLGSESDWLNSLKGKDGINGKEPMFFFNDGILQYRFSDEDDWVVLYKSSYLYEQNTLANIWEVNHGLGQIIVSVDIIDSDGNIVITKINYVDENNLSIVFANPKMGSAIIRR